MDYGDHYWELYRGNYRDPFPHSLLSQKTPDTNSWPSLEIGLHLAGFQLRQSRGRLGKGRVLLGFGDGSGFSFLGRKRLTASWAKCFEPSCCWPRIAAACLPMTLSNTFTILVN